MWNYVAPGKWKCFLCLCVWGGWGVTKKEERERERWLRETAVYRQVKKERGGGGKFSKKGHSFEGISEE